MLNVIFAHKALQTGLAIYCKDVSNYQFKVYWWHHYRGGQMYITYFIMYHLKINSNILLATWSGNSDSNANANLKDDTWW